MEGHFKSGVQSLLNRKSAFVFCIDESRKKKILTTAITQKIVRKRVIN